MRIEDIFETRIQEKIEPVIKVGERHNAQKLAAEIGAYVVTPTIEKYVDDFLEHYTDTFHKNTTENGVWISGYFGSGKSHLAKILALLCENPDLDGLAAARRFEPRLPSDAPRRSAILRSLAIVSQCQTQALAFNINTLADSKATPLARLLLSQYYQSKGYGANSLYARVIEAELDERGLLPQLHQRAEQLARKPWADIQKNPNFYARALYQAACETAPDIFARPEDVAQALKNAEQGELYNIQFLVSAILADLERRQRQSGKLARLLFVLDESGQWIEDDAGRLSQLQALVEEAGNRGQGKIWVMVTTHEDMGAIYQNARALQGDFKKIEGRFRFKFSLTTENIERVLEDRIFRKTVAGRREVESTYQANPGVLRDLGELKHSSQKLPDCTLERYATFYPFLPYQIHLIPELVKSLRSAGGRGEQLSGSTRTLLAISQDILRAGRRAYLAAPVGELVSFDEIFANLAGEGEVSPDVRSEMNRIENVVAGATPLTRRVAEALYLIQQLNYVPRSLENIARLLVEASDEDLAQAIGRVQPELERLIAARLAALIGSEYEFLTGERRTFEEEVAAEKASLRVPHLREGLAKFVNSQTLGFTTIPYKGHEFQPRFYFDDTALNREGAIEIRVYSPFEALSLQITDLENTSLRPENHTSLYVLCGRIPAFESILAYYLAMKAVVERWKGDPHKSEQARKLAADRELIDLIKLRGAVQTGIHDGLRQAVVVFRGASRPLYPKPGQPPAEALRAALAKFWPTLYNRYERVPVRLLNEQRAILDVLGGSKSLGDDVEALGLFDRSGQVALGAPLLDALRVYLVTRQGRSERTLGQDLTRHFTSPPFGWDAGCVRLAAAALVRAGVLRLLVEKKAYVNPADPDLQNTLRVSRNFERAELTLEDSEMDPELLTEARKQLISLTGTRKIDETPAALSAAFHAFAQELLDQAKAVTGWADPAQFPLPPRFQDACERLGELLAIANPLHQVRELVPQAAEISADAAVIRSLADFKANAGHAFAALRDLQRLLSPLRERFDERSAVQGFVRNWEGAARSAAFAEAEVWRQIQQTGGSARLELEQAAQRWRKESIESVQTMLDSLRVHPAALSPESGVTQADLEAILSGFIQEQENETRPEHLAQASERARRVLQKYQQTLENARPKPPRPKLHTIRLSEVTQAEPIASLAQWQTMLERLDAAVRESLERGEAVRFE